MKRQNAMVLATVISVGFAPGVWAQENDKGIVSDGELRILNNPIYPPMEFVNEKTGEVDGFDIDIGKEIASRLSLKPVFVKTSFNDLQSGIQTGRGDLIISGVTNTPARSEAMELVNYVISGPTFFTLSSNADVLKSQNDLCGKIVAGSRAAVALISDVQKWSKQNCVDNGKPAIVYEGVADSNAARLGMKQGRYNAVAQGSETLNWLLTQEPDTYNVLGDPISGTSIFAIGLKKGNLVLRNEVQNAINAMIADGSYEEILSKWQLNHNSIAGASKKL